MDGKSPCESPFVTFYNNVIVLFLYFITGLGQSGPKGNSQTWRWIRLRSEMDRRQAKGSKRWAWYIWCFNLSGLVFDFFCHLLWKCERQYYQVIKKNKRKHNNQNDLPARCPCAHNLGKHQGEKAHRSAKTPWNSSKCLFLCWHLQRSIPLPPSLSQCFFPVLLYLAFRSFSKMFPAYPMINNYASASN